MILSRIVVVAAVAMLSGPVSASASDGCAPMQRLIQQARNDFPSLRSLKMQPGVCTLRAAEYQCRWAFPGDAFAAAETQTAALVQCASAKSGAPPQKRKRGQTAIALESDLALIVDQPEIDSGQWVVSLRIVSEPTATD